MQCQSANVEEQAIRSMCCNQVLQTTGSSEYQEISKACMLRQSKMPSPTLLQSLPRELREAIYGLVIKDYLDEIPVCHYDPKGSKCHS